MPACLKIVGTIVLLAAASRAQSNSGCLHRMFPVTVVDKHGNAVSDLPVSAFRAELQHRPVKLLSATFQTQQPRIVVLLDTSRSISSTPDEWELAKFLVADIVNSGAPESDLAFATFATHVTVEVPFGKGRDAIREVLLERARPLRPAAVLQSHTALCDAILEVTKLFGTPRLGDAIYAITDGMDNESRGGIGQMQHELEQEGIRLFGSILHSGMFRFPNGRMLPPDLRIIPDGLRIVAQHTGGYSLIFDVARFNHTVGSTRAMASAAQTIYHRLAPFYAVDAELPSALDKPREWKLEVLNSGSKTAKSLSVL